MGRAVLQHSHCTRDTARRLDARGAQARRAGHAGRRRALGAQASARRAGERWAGARGAARALGVLLANRLCTWCTQPIFDPV